MAEEHTPAVKPGKPRRAHPNPRRNALRWLGEFALYVVIAIVVVSLVRVFLVQPFLVPSGSMEQTLQVGDTIVAWKPGAPERGQIVVFRDDQGWLPPGPEVPGWKKVLAFVKVLPPQDEQYLVKRLIGLPGDHVTCCDAKGRITVNGQPLDESGYLNYNNKSVALRGFDLVVPEGHIFVLGDHRDSSQDSRHWMCNGPNYPFPTVESIQGRVFAIMRPFSRAQTFDIPDTFASVPEPTGSPPSTEQATWTCS